MAKGKKNEERVMKISAAMAIAFTLLIVAFIAYYSYSWRQAPTTIVASGNMSTVNIANGTIVTASADQRIDNFLIQSVYPDSVYGLLYIEYPVAYLQGSPTNLHPGDTIGYACDGTLAQLAWINGTRAAFTVVASKPQKYGCPI